MTVEEAKFYPTPNLEPVPLEPPDVDLGNLPSSYGKNRLVLLPVDPYLIYAYWELADDPPPTAGARAVLRFHENPGRPFDVEIDLAARNCYVHLWSPNKTCQAALGLRGEDGALVVLAQSNTTQTPPASPVPQTAEAYPLPDGRGSEVVAEPRASASGLVREFLQLSTSPRPQRDLSEIFEPFTVTDFSLALPFEVEADPEAVEFEDTIPAEPIPFDLADLAVLDLTEYSEHRFTPGISSDGGPLGD